MYSIHIDICSSTLSIFIRERGIKYQPTSTMHICDGSPAFRTVLISACLRPQWRGRPTPTCSGSSPTPSGPRSRPSAWKPDIRAGTRLVRFPRVTVVFVVFILREGVKNRLFRCHNVYAVCHCLERKCEMFAHIVTRPFSVPNADKTRRILSNQNV